MICHRIGERGRTPMRLIFAIALVLMCFRSVAYAYEGRRANSMLLNGVWEFVVGDGDEGAEVQDEQVGLAWQEVTLPGQFTEWSQDAATTIKFVWARRTAICSFLLTPC